MFPIFNLASESLDFLKPGQCPEPLFVDECPLEDESECVGDDECPGTQKCCTPDGCVLRCVAAILPVFQRGEPGDPGPVGDPVS